MLDFSFLESKRKVSRNVKVFCFLKFSLRLMESFLENRGARGILERNAISCNAFYVQCHLPARFAAKMIENGSKLLPLFVVIFSLN
jgi:hypothetical protein